jgi:hypothetical protein
MSIIIVESKPCGNDGYTTITVKGPDAEDLYWIIMTEISKYEIEQKRKKERELS